MIAGSYKVDIVKDRVITLALHGDWIKGLEPPDLESLLQEFEHNRGIRSVAFEV